jgi:hypothetical protein
MQSDFQETMRNKSKGTRKIPERKMCLDKSEFNLIADLLRVDEFAK